MRVLGALLLVGALVALGVFAWPLLKGGAKAPSGTPPRSRAEKVRGNGEPPPTTDVVTSKPPPIALRGPLCDRTWTAETGPVFTAPATQELRPGTPPVGGWTWLNLWAAWCGPCKEEMPLLDTFAQKSGVRLVLWSVDDDVRQVHRFLMDGGQSLKSEVALVPETAREGLYASLHVGNPPRLPVQALIDPTGRLRCVREGAVDAADLIEATKTFLHPKR